MSKRLNTMSTGGPGGADTLICSNFPEKNLLAGFLLRFFYPVTVAGAGGAAPTVLDMLTAMITSLSIRYGTGGTKVPYSTVPGAEIDVISRYMARADQPNNLADIVFTIAADYTVRVDVLISFQLETTPDGKKRLPGWMQARSMVIDLVEGPALNLALGDIARTVGANMLVDVDVLTFPTEIDQAGPVLSYTRANQSSLRAELPEQLLAGAWEISDPQATTPITLQSLSVGGIKEEDVVPPYVAGDKYGLLYATGAGDITDVATMVYSPWQNQPASEFPIGKPVYELASQDIPQIQLRALGWPLETLQDAKDNAKQASEAGPVVAQKGEDAETVTDYVSRTLPAKMYPQGHPKFTLGEGLIAPGGGADPYVSMPGFKAIGAGAAVETAATSGANTMAASQSAVLAALGRKIPGVAAQVAKEPKGAVVEPSTWAEALKSAAGDKGIAGVDRVLKAIKL